MKAHYFKQKIYGVDPLKEVKSPRLDAVELGIKNRHQNMLADYIEKGLEIPEALLRSFHDEEQKKRVAEYREISKRRLEQMRQKKVSSR